MRGPVITVDVSKGSCHYQPFLENGKPLRKARVLHDTIEGFSDLKETIEKVKEKGVVETVSVVFEAIREYITDAYRSTLMITVFLTSSSHRYYHQRIERRICTGIRPIHWTVPTLPRLITARMI